MTTEETRGDSSNAPEATEPEEDKASLFESVKILVGASRGYLMVNWVNIGDGIAYFGMLALMTLHMRENVGFSTPMSTFAISLFSGLVTLFMAFGGGTVCDRLGVRRALSFSMGVVLIGRVIFVMSPWLVTSTAVAAAAWISIVIMGFGEGVLQPTLYAGVKEYADKRTATMGFAFLYSVMNLGIIIGELISPKARSFYAENVEGVSLADQPTAGIAGAFWFFIAVTAIVLVVTLLMFTRKVEARDRVTPEVVPKKEGEEGLGLVARIRALPILDARFIFFIFILYPVRTLFAHQFLTMPDYVTRAFPPEVGAHWEWVYALNPFIIVIFVPVFAAFTLRVRVVDMMIFGTLVSATATFLLVPEPNLGFLLGYIIIFSLGEALWSSRFLEYVADLAPAGKVGIYMGIAGIPWFMAKFLTGTYAGFMVDAFLPLTGSQQPGAMWLVYALLAMVSPIGLIFARRWLLGADQTGPDMQKVSGGLKWVGAVLVIVLAAVVALMLPRFDRPATPAEEIPKIASRIPPEVQAIIEAGPGPRPVEARLQPYPLPLNPAQVANWQAVVGPYLAGRPGATKLLRENGFVSTGFAGDDVVAFYAAVQARGVPIFLTSDTVLHFYRLALARNLAEFEEKTLFEDARALSAALGTTSRARLDRATNEERAALQRLAAFFAVAEALATRDGTRVALLTARRRVATFNPNDERIASFARDFPIAFEAAQRHAGSQEKSASETADDPGLGEMLADLRALAAPVHFEDKPTLLRHLDAALARLPKDDTTVAGDRDETVASLVTRELALIFGQGGLARSPILRHQEDYAQYAPEGHYAQSEKLARYHRTVTWLNHLLGFAFDRPLTREILDGTRLSDGRGALEVRTRIALLGAPPQSDFEGRDRAVAALRDRLESGGSKGSLIHLSGRWLGFYEALMAEVPAGYPSFMAGPAWGDKQVNTTLAIWSQRAHDPVLRANLGVDSLVAGAPAGTAAAGYVEPVPELYERLAGAVRVTLLGLARSGSLSASVQQRLTTFAEVLDRLSDLARRELDNQALRPEDHAFIRDLAPRLAAAVADAKVDGLETSLIRELEDKPGLPVLTVGTGNLRHLVVVHPLPDGRLQAAVGPTFSYYEIQGPAPWPVDNRGWRKRLAGKNPPPLPKWTRSFARDD